MRESRMPRSSLTLGILLLAGAASARAEDGLGPTFDFDFGREVFVHVPGRRLTISRGCRRSEGEFACLAYSSIESARTVRFQPPLDGGANPGSLLCRKIGGNVVIGRDSERNENSFCRFKDGSLVDNGTLFYHRARGAREGR